MLPQSLVHSFLSFLDHTSLSTSMPHFHTTRSSSEIHAK